VIVVFGEKRSVVRLMGDAAWDFCWRGGQMDFEAQTGAAGAAGYEQLVEDGVRLGTRKGRSRGRGGLPVNNCVDG
jgi:hypothetical protein